MKNLTRSWKINEEAIVIEKDGMSVIVVFNDHLVLVVDANTIIDGEPFIALSKKFETKSECYEEWLHVMGKMLKKNSNSKYFGSKKLEEHLNNGPLEEKDKKAALKLARNVSEEFKKMVKEN